MRGKSVLLSGRDERRVRVVTTCLRAAGNEVVLADSVAGWQGLIGAHAADLAIVDYRGMQEATRYADIAGRGDVPVIALADRGDAHELLELFCAHAVDHVVSPELDTAELVTTVEKLLRDEPFGLDKYLTPFGVEPARHDLTGSADLDDAIDAVREFAHAVGASDATVDALGRVTEQLCGNAIYDGPRDYDGRARFAAGHGHVELHPSEYAELQFGTDGRNIAIAVSDPFGSLTPERLRARLVRYLTEPYTPVEGLYGVLFDCDQLVFDIEPGRCTEVIAISALDRPSPTGHSLHVFRAAPQPAVAAVSDAVPMTIVVGESAPVETATARGQLLAFPTETLEIGAMFAMIDAATTPDRAIELGLRFLHTCYAGAIAFEVADDTLVPWFGAGEVADWPECQTLRIPLDAELTLTEMVRRARTDRYRPATQRPADANLHAITAGDADPSGAVVCVRAQGRVTHVLFGFCPRYPRPIASHVLYALRSKLDAAMARLAPPSQHARATPPRLHEADVH